MYVGIVTLLILHVITNLLPTNGIRQGNICRNEIVNGTKRNHTSAERDMKYHSPKTTI